MKNRLCCFLLSVLVLSASISFADQHLDAQVVFSGALEGTHITMDIYEQNDSLIAVSSLFPEYAFEMPADNESLSVTDILLLLSLNPESIADALQTADQYLISWLDTLTYEHSEGVYAGDLFDNATSVNTYAFSCSDLTDYLRNLYSVQEKQLHNNIINEYLFSSICSVLHHNDPDNHMIFNVKSYDFCRFITVENEKKGSIIMTFSIDRTDNDQRRILIGWTEEKKNYFRDITIQTDKQFVSVLSTLLSGSGTTVRNNGQYHLLSEQFVYNINSDQIKGFEWIIDPERMTSPVITSGNIITSENGQMQINAVTGIKGFENEKMILTIDIDKNTRPVIFTDKQIIKSDSTDKNEIVLSALSSITMIAAELIPSLPAEYQKMIMTLLFN